MYKESMSLVKALKIIGAWFAIATIPILVLVIFTPLAGAVYAMAFLAIVAVLIGAPIQVVLAWKFANSPIWAHFIFAFVSVIAIFIFVFASGMFNFT